MSELFMLKKQKKAQKKAQKKILTRTIAIDGIPKLKDSLIR